MKHICKYLLLLGLCQAMPLYAGMADDMQKFFNGSGYAANITSSKAAVGQEGGYVSAGSGFIRTPVKNMQLIHVKPPSLRMGCGGIDLFAGGFDFISSEKITEFAQAIMQNAVPFAIDLALQTWAPQIKDGLDFLKQQANMINQFNMSSCEAAQTLVAGVAGSFQKNDSDSFICKTYASHTNEASSWLANKQGCNDAKTSKETNEQAKKNPEMADMVKQNRNLVWYFLLKNDFLKANTQIAEYIMAMTGTLITKTDAAGKSTHTTYEPLMIDEKSSGFEVMLHGETVNGEAQKVKIYECDDNNQEKCLTLEEKELAFDKSKALVPQIQKDLEDIAQKLLEDNKLTPAQQNMINAVNFPMLRLIENQVNAGWIPEYHLYADILARIILSHYLNQVIAEAKFALTQHDLGKDEDIRRVINNINKAQTLVVNKMETKAYEKLQHQSQLLMRSLELEKIVVGEMSAAAQNNYYFGHTN